MVQELVLERETRQLRTRHHLKGEEEEVEGVVMAEKFLVRSEQPSQRVVFLVLQYKHNLIVSRDKSKRCLTPSQHVGVPKHDTNNFLDQCLTNR